MTIPAFCFALKSAFCCLCFKFILILILGFLPLAPPRDPIPVIPTNPCVPSPCGPNSQCQAFGDTPSCSCLQNYIGAPPNCRPECVINSECSSNLACINEKCRDPCPGACGLNAVCSVYNHVPICTCIDGYEGDALSSCSPKPVPTPQDPVIEDPCYPSPCGPNAQCQDGICTCWPEYQGDPYTGCRPECTLSSDCPRDKACIRNKCVDPCPGTCGSNAICEVVNHVPMCKCPPGTRGNAFIDCRPYQDIVINPCSPSPCGPNSQCREINGQAVCSCVVGYQGSPPNCRPECVTHQECPQNQACLNQKCRDPCPGTCGIGAKCTVVNHNPICSCPARYTGDPFVRCQPISKY